MVDTDKPCANRLSLASTQKQPRENNRKRKKLRPGRANDKRSLRDLESIADKSSLFVFFFSPLVSWFSFAYVSSLPSVAPSRAPLVPVHRETGWSVSSRSQQHPRLLRRSNWNMASKGNNCSLSRSISPRSDSRPTNLWPGHFESRVVRGSLPLRGNRAPCRGSSCHQSPPPFCRFSTFRFLFPGRLLLPQKAENCRSPEEAKSQGI